MCKKLNYLIVVGFVLSLLGQAMAIDESLVLYLPLDEGEGTVAGDASMYANDGEIVGSATWVEGYIGGGLELTGGASVSIPEIPQYDVTSEMSALGWIKVASVTTWARILDKSTYQTSGFDLALNNDTHVPRLEFFVANTSSIADGTTPCDDDEWHFVVGTFGNKTVRMYVDGVLEGEGQSANSVDINPNDLPLTVGNSADNNPLTGVVDEIAMFDRELTADEVATMFVSGIAMGVATKPQPANDATDVRRDVVLNWKPDRDAVGHDVYFGTVLADVEAAARANPMGVLVGQAQSEATYDPDGLLDYGTTYYWRIDEVTADGTVMVGQVWSFTTEPYLYPITNIEATSNGTPDPGQDPANAVDGSGLNADGQHSVVLEDMWLATPPAGELPWFLCTFDRPYKLREMQVWNHNSTFELYVGFGCKDVTVEYSPDGTDWVTLGDYEFARAPGTSGYEANTTVEFGDIAVKAVKLTIHSGFLTMGKYGLSELRFLHLPAQARGPEPADGATDASVDTVLTWREGRETVQSEVYLDTADATTLLTTTEATMYEPGPLDLGTTYYWKVDEIEAESVWEGQLWSFSTEAYTVIDDFETYDDDEVAETTIWQTWLDGLEDGSLGGSMVGNDPSPFAEMDIVYSGSQAMPLFYDNTAAPYYSMTKRTFATPQNWVRAGATTLVIYFHGDFANVADPLYAEINGTRIPFDGGAEVITRPLWRQWNIDLSAVGNLQSVQSLAIGIGDGSPGGTGVLYIDTIRLYRVAPEAATPVDPGTNGLAAYYAFEDNVSDGADGYDGTVMGNEIYEDSPYDAGRAISLDGLNDYVELPIGPVMASSNSMTIATRFNMLPNTNNWQRIFDFGNSNSTGYMFLSPQMGTSGATMRFAITAAGGGAAESSVDVSGSISEGWHHVAVAIDSVEMTITIYLDGAEVASGATATIPSDLGQTTQNWLGRSQYEADGYYMGLLDEFRIYDRALSAGEVRYLAGDR